MYAFEKKINIRHFLHKETVYYFFSILGSELCPLQEDVITENWAEQHFSTGNTRTQEKRKNSLKSLLILFVKSRCIFVKLVKTKDEEHWTHVCDSVCIL